MVLLISGRGLFYFCPYDPFAKIHLIIICFFTKFPFRYRCATFEVPYEFELAEDITVPANCVLEFDGGSISGNSIYSIDFNSAIIDADKRLHIYNNLADFSNIHEISAKWFGAKGDGVTDDTNVFKFLLNRKFQCVENGTPSDTIIHIPAGLYIVSDCINSDCYTDTDGMSSQYKLLGEGNITSSTYYPQEDGYIEEPNGSFTIIKCIGNQNTPFIYLPSLIKDITIVGERGAAPTYFTTYAKYDNTTGILVGRINNYGGGQLENVRVMYFGTGIKIGSSYGLDWKNVSASRCYYGVAIDNSFTPHSGYVTSRFDRLQTDLNKKTGLYIDIPTGVFIFNRCVSQFNNIEKDAQSGHDGYQIYCASSRAVLYFDVLYVENGSNAVMADKLCQFPPQTIISNPLFAEGTYTITNDNDIRYKFKISGLKNGTNVLIDANHCFGIIETSFFTELANYENVSLFENSIGTFSYNNFSGTVMKAVSPSAARAAFGNNADSPMVPTTGIPSLYIRSNNIESFIPMVREVTSNPSVSDMDYALGCYLFNKTLNIPIFLRENGWTDALGFAAKKKVGYTATRPSGLTADDEGYIYFDLTLHKPIWWNGSSWTDATGAPV